MQGNDTTVRSGLAKLSIGRKLRVLCVLFGLLMTAQSALAADQQREQVVTIVTQIQRADYEGDRAALKRLHEELAPSTKDKKLAARIQYWRGFALWRRAINGFNDDVNEVELRDDLKQALNEFNEAATEDTAFADAKIAALSCVSLIGYTLIRNNPARLQDADVQELWTKGRQLRKEIEAIAPENPRLLWVVGPNLWATPPERGGSQTKVMDMYQKGLETIRKNKTSASDPLEPSWGEPELLMNLAWSNLHRTTPDLNAAEQYANSALSIVPYWHYVKDILLPQIRDAKKKQN
jgi:hypothetical protein